MAISFTAIGRVFIHFPFFLYGNIVHRYWDKSQKVMDSKWFYPLVIILVIWATLDVLKWHQLRLEWTNLPSTIAKFGLLTIVFMYAVYWASHPRHLPHPLLLHAQCACHRYVLRQVPPQLRPRHHHLRRHGVAYHWLLHHLVKHPPCQSLLQEVAVWPVMKDDLKHVTKNHNGYSGIKK